MDVWKPLARTPTEWMKGWCCEDGCHVAKRRRLFLILAPPDAP
jgi:hypothetical protein